MFDSIYTQIGAILVVAVLAFAMLKGGEPERVFAGVYLVAWLATMLVQTDSNLFAWQGWMFAIDSVGLAVLVMLTWKSQRAWPIWAAAFQLLVLAGLLIPWIDVRPPAWSYIAVVNIGTYGVLICLAVGTFWAWQERRAAGLE